MAPRASSLGADPAAEREDARALDAELEAAARRALRRLFADVVGDHHVLLEAPLQLRLGARFELTGAFARHAEAPSDLCERELLRIVRHHPNLDDEALPRV